MEFVKRMAGQEYVGFSNATWVHCQIIKRYVVVIYLHLTHLSSTAVLGRSPVHCPIELLLFQRWPLPIVCLRFQSEKETGDRNFAIGYYMKEKKVSYSTFSYSAKICRIINPFYFRLHLFERKLNVYILTGCCAFTCMFSCSFTEFVHRNWATTNHFLY